MAQDPCFYLGLYAKKKAPTQPLRLAKFESLWIWVCSLVAVWGSRSGCLWIPDAVFSFFSPLLNSGRVFSSIFTSIDYGWMSFTADCLPFYSVILRFLGYHWFPPFAPLGTKTNVVSATLVAGPFLILPYFLLLRFLLQKPLADFPVLRDPRRLTFVLSFSKASRFHFSDPPFGCFPFCHFFQVSWFLSVRLKDPQPPSFMVLLPRFLELPDPYSWVVGSQAFWSLFYIIGWLIGTYLFWFLMFLGMPPWTILIPTWLCCMSWGSRAPRNP